MRKRRAFIRQLAATRETVGLSQSEVARRMGVRPSVVSRFESGSDPRHSTEDRYAAAIGARVLRSIVMNGTSPDTKVGGGVAVDPPPLLSYCV